MVGGGGALNLSLLSRGIGEVQQNGHEKVEVFLEPEDYFNYVRDPKRIYLPPIQAKYPYFSTPATESARVSKKLDLPKTFTTRRGALLLFSEDLAQRNHLNEGHLGALTRSLDTSKDVDIRTVDDLAKSILSYGKEDMNNTGDVFLGFVHTRRKFQKGCQIRPGFSAKRYLSTWTRIWDDSLLENIINKGYITERSLFYGSMVAPSLRRRIFHDDLSHYPQPYRLMRNMLISPGSLSGYTFYRMEIQELDLVAEDEEVPERQQKSRASIAVVKTKDGVQREVSYSNLDKQCQKEVLTDLLVKSAVNYALQKQQEFVESLKHPSPENVHLATDGQIDVFNMEEAVESLLETEKETREFENRSQNASKHLMSPHQSSQSSSWPHTSSPVKSTIQLPTLDRRHLSTIEDVSREGTSVRVLPPIGQSSSSPPDIQPSPAEYKEEWGLHVGASEETILKTTSSGSESRRNEGKNDTKSTSVSAGPFQAAKSHFANDYESFSHARPVPVTRQKRPWAGSTHSLKSVHSSRNAASLIGDGSLKGSLIAAPGGEIVRVGGSVAHSESQGQVDVANLMEVTRRKSLEESKSIYHMTDESDAEETEVWPSVKTDKRTTTSLYGYGRNSVTEQGIVDALTEHAQAIAAHILVAGGGMNLEEDIRKAANLWMKTHPARKLSRSQSVQEFTSSQAIDAVMKSQRINSAAPTSAEYKYIIKQSITTAVASATGLDLSDLTLESDISDELLEALANQNISPDEVKIVKDPLTGRSQLTTSRNSLKEGHLYMEPNGGSEKSNGRPPISIPSDRSSVKDIGGVDIISYVAPEPMESESNKSDRSKGSQSKRSSVSEERKSASSQTQEIESRRQSVQGMTPEDVTMATSDMEVTETVIEKLEEPASPVVKETVPATEPLVEPIPPVEATETVEPIKTVVPTQTEPVPEKQEASDLSNVKSQNSPEIKKTPPKSKPLKLEQRDEFVVGKMKEEKENEKLYGHVDPPPKHTSAPKGKPKEKKPKAPPAPAKKEKKKPKKGKQMKKAEAPVVPSPPVTEKVKPEPIKLPEPSPPPKSTTPRMDSALRSESQRSFATSESDGMEFIIIRDRSPSPSPVASPVASPPKPTPPQAEPETPAEESDDDDNKLNLISNKDARAAKRAAAAVKRREEVERKRREREEDAKREKDKQDRDRQRELEADETRRKQEEQRRLRKQQEEADRLREELESREREKRQVQEVEREKRLKEERQRRFEEMKRKQAEDELKRLELLLLKQKEEEERLILEEEKKSQMEEEERIEYERKMKEEEELRKLQEALEKQRREEESARLLEEARQKAIAEARKRMEIEARLAFNRSLQLESQGLSEHSHKISEAFVFSYYEILQWLGLDIPEFELQKLEHQLL